MNISDSSFILGSGIGNSIRTNQKNTENISDRNTTTKVNSSANSDIVQANKGQSFKGEITGITGDRVDILLENNKNLSARMAESVNMNIGDNITFQIKENNGSNVVISPITEGLGNMKDNAIFSILDANGFSPTEKNYNIAMNLLDNNMSVDKGTMQKIMQQSYKYPDASINSIVQLNKLNIPVNDASIKQYNDYVANSHQLVSDINNIATSISDMQTAIMDEVMNLPNATSSEILNINDKIVSILSDDIDLPTDIATQQSSEEAALQMGDLQNTIGDDNVENLGNTLDAVKQDESGFVNENTNINADLVDDIQNNNENNLSNAIQTSDNNENAELKQINNIDNTELKQVDNIETKYGLDKAGLEDLSKQLRELGLDENKIQNMVEESDTAMKLLNNIKNELYNTSELAADKLKEFFDSKEYKQVLERGIRDKFTLNPEKMKNPKEIDELYKGILEKTNKLMEAFEGKGGQANQQFKEQSQNVAERIDFINNLNNTYAYSQIPLKMNSKELNSELFVYMNKKTQKENKDAVSALLHLDMDHLGPTDVHVSLHGGIVHTRFYVEDEASAKIIDDHMTMLEKAINESGYKLTNEVITREPTLDHSANAVVDNMFDSELEKSVKRYTFDMRM